MGDVRRGPARRDRGDSMTCPASTRRRAPRRGTVRVVLRPPTPPRARRLPGAICRANRSPRSRCLRRRWSSELDYEHADAGPAAGPAAIARRRRTRSPAGLRGGHQGPRPVPDAARQQDHPRDREVTATREPASRRRIRPRTRFRFARSRSGSRAGSTSWARSGSKGS